MGYQNSPASARIALAVPQKWRPYAAVPEELWLAMSLLSHQRAGMSFVKCLFGVQFVCVEVLRPSQPNGVMSSAVSLPNHTFTGQA